MWSREWYWRRTAHCCHSCSHLIESSEKYWIFNPLDTQIKMSFIYPVRTAQWTHPVSIIKNSQLMQYREIIAVGSAIHAKHTSTLCGQNVKLVNIKPGGTYSNHRALNS
jgi:hypothetical protein